MWSVLGLGALQGLTEFLPVSSSGHLIVLKTILGVASPGAALEVALHLGTLAAVLWAYRRWIGRWLKELAQGRRAAWRLMGLLTAASVPAAGAGLLLGHVVEQYFTVGAVAVGWMCTTVLLWATPIGRSGRPLEQMRWWQAAVIGCAQALALWPGLSRSGTTIAMARAVGVKGEDAAQFSFLMAIPAVVGASLFEFGAMSHPGVSWSLLILAALLAAVTGVVAIQWVKGIVQQSRAWRAMGIYTAAAAVAVWLIGG